MSHKPPAVKVNRNTERWRKKDRGRRKAGKKKAEERRKKKKEQGKRDIGSGKIKDEEKKHSSAHKADFGEDFSCLNRFYFLFN